jgi:hypothetical protein
MNGLLAQQGIGRYTVKAAQCLDFIEPCGTLPLLNGNKRSTSDACRLAAASWVMLAVSRAIFNLFAQHYWAQLKVWLGHDASSIHSSQTTPGSKVVR